MWKRSCSLLAAVLVIAAAAASAAQASRFRVEPTSSSSFRMTWAGNFKMIRGSESAQCAVTLLGSFHSSTFPKVSSVLIGYIFEARMDSCRGKTAAFAEETLPWHVQYESFGGALPEITELNVQITEMLIIYYTFHPITWCNARATASTPFRMRILRTEEGALNEVRLVEEPIVCNAVNLVPESAGTIGTMVRWVEPERQFTLVLI